jgi:hypothetical protein
MLLAYDLPCTKARQTLPVTFREQKNPREAEACGEILPKEGGGDIGQTTHAAHLATVAALENPWHGPR